MPSINFYNTSGNPYVDGVLSGVRWGTTSLTFSFPALGAFYGSGYGEGEPSQGFEALNSTQRVAVGAALAAYSAVSSLIFTEVTETLTVHGDLRFAESSRPSTAWAYYPSTAAEGGDTWFNKVHYNNPAKGTYAYDTVLHEIGHALGLKHGHEVDAPFGAVPIERDFMAYTVMSYRSYQGQSLSGGYTNGSVDYPQSLMMYDIAAIQYMYGANFNTNSGNTTYTWSSTNGQMFINGVAQGAPAGNRIFLTIWDGSGTDTYDFANYTTNLSVNLAPGGWTTTSSGQLARLQSNGSMLAPGNIANAVLYQGDTRSLIENAIGGTGHDLFHGNVGSNSLIGGSGNDDLYGEDGHDTLTGGGGYDYLDGGSGNDIAIYSGTYSSYLISRDGIYWVIEDQRGGGTDWTDWLINIETFRFENGDFAPAVSAVNGDDSANVLIGSSDADIMDGFGGNDDLYGRDGNDTLRGGTGYDYIDGGAGSDVATYAGNFADYTLSRTGGYWVVTDTRSGGGTDWADWLINVETIRFSNGDVSLGVLVVGDGGANNLQGSSSSDVMYGHAGNDDLYGRDGADTLVGGAGYDYIDGGTGNDISAYSGNFTDYAISRNGAYWIVEDTRGGGGTDWTDYVINVETLLFGDGSVATASLGTQFHATEGAEISSGLQLQTEALTYSKDWDLIL